MSYLDFYAYSCDEAPSIDSQPCSCTDCKLTCPAIDTSCSSSQNPSKEPAFTIGTVDGVSVIVLIVFLVLVFFFLLYLLVSYMTNRKYHRKSGLSKATPSTSSMAKMTPYADSDTQSDSSCFTDDDDQQPLVDKASISCIDRLGKASQDFFRKIFTWWGTFVASHPLWVIFFTVIIVAVLCVGVMFIKLTTDPVELWTSETSRVRQEKKYYDEKFGAFYRTEMVILKLKKEYEGPGDFYTSYTGIKHKFSEILKKEYLLELLELQNKIRYLSVNYEEDGVEKEGTLNVRKVFYLQYVDGFVAF